MTDLSPAEERVVADVEVSPEVTTEAPVAPETPVEPAKTTTPKKVSKEDDMLIRQKLVASMDEFQRVPDIEVQLPLETIFQKSVALILAASDITCSQTVLEHISLLAMDHMHDITSRLHRITEIQRRRRIALKDVKVLVKEEVVSLRDVEDAYEETKAARDIGTLKRKLYEETEEIVHEINERTAGEQTVDIQDPAACFFHDISGTIATVVPQKPVRKSYIPKYMPELPPAHTYRATAQYTETIKDPRVLREKLVEEGRLGEKALQHILGDTPLMQNAREYSEPEVGSESEDEKSERPEGKPENLETLAKPVGSEENSTEVKTEDKSEETQEPKEPEITDIVAYAKKRRHILEKRAQEKAKELEQRLAKPETIVSKYMGSFSIKPVDESVSRIVSDIYATEFDNALNSVKIGQKRRAKWLRQEEKKRQKAEEEKRKQQESIEFGFGESGMPDEDEDLDFNFDFGNEDMDVDRFDEPEPVVATETAPTETTQPSAETPEPLEAGPVESNHESTAEAELTKSTTETPKTSGDADDIFSEPGAAAVETPVEPQLSVPVAPQSDDESDEFDDSMFDEVM